MTDVFQSRRLRAPQPEVRRARGQPVLVLAMVLGAWTLLRVATWTGLPESDDPARAGSPLQAYSLIEQQPTESAGADGPREDGPPQVTHRVQMQAAWPAREPLPEPAPRSPVMPSATGVPQAPVSAPSPTAAQPVAPDRATRARAIAGHTLLMAAGFAQMQLPPEIAAWFNALPADRARRWPAEQGSDTQASLAGTQRQAGEPAASATRRWSADGWLLWRDDSSSPLLSGRPAYGRSQAGAVVRYHLAPSSGHRPQAYLRGSAALQGSREQEAALGLSARPLARVPVRLAAELRASDRTDGTSLRPAAFAVTELPPQPLPGGLVAEGYGAAGYVGGQGSTAFVDGQVRVDRSLASVRDFTLRAGGGAWGGAQQGAARLDIGPTASLSFNLGETRARVAADYRVRVAGDARPASGPALTLSAGF